jgi:glycosyltransferase 2 family protein
MKRIRSVTLKLCVLAGLLGFLIYFHFIDLSVLIKILARPYVFVGAAAAIFLSYFSGTFRWWLLLRSQRIKMPYERAFQLYTVSVFSLLFVPGGTGSADAVRSVMLMQTVPTNRSGAVLTVFADRVIAVFVLSLIAAGLSLSHWSSRWIDPAESIFWLNVWTILVPVAIPTVTWAAWYITRTPAFRGKGGGRMARLTSELSNFFTLIFQSPSTVLLAVLASGITTALTLSAVAIAGTAAGIPDLSTWQIAHAAAIAMFANGLPISPGGIGVGEAAFNQICIWITHSPHHFAYATIFLAYRVISLVVACYGGIALVKGHRLMRPVQAVGPRDSEPHSAQPSPAYQAFGNGISARSIQAPAIVETLQNDVRDSERRTIHTGGANLVTIAVERDLDQWQEYVRRRAPCNPMLDSAWYRVLGDAFSVERTFIICWRDDSCIAGVVPLYVSRNPFTCHVTNLEDGWHADDEGSANALLEAAKSVAAERRARYVLLRRAEPLCGAADRIVPTVRRIIDTSRPAETILATVKKKNRWSIRQAVANGFTVEMDESLQRLDVFYRLYARHMRDLGTPVMSPVFMQSLKTHFGPPRLKLFFVCREGREIGGMLCIAAADLWLNMYAVVRKELMAQYPNYLLYWHAIERAANEGVSHFDLGRSRPSSPTHFFKTKWPGADREVPHCYFGAGIPAAVDRIRERSSLFQRGWKHVPLPVANWLGPKMRNQLPFG